MKKQKIRDARRMKKKQTQIKTLLVFSIVSLGVFVIVGVLVWNVIRPAVGEPVQIMANAMDHIPDGSVIDEYSSQPPTSGPHYRNRLEAGFYVENVENEEFPNLENPEGYLLHNLEHGYVIYWYNCDVLEETGCEELKTQIRASMADNQEIKLIAYPRPSLEVPVVLTSWGRKYSMDEFDPNIARQFVRANRNRAPEPTAP